MRIDDNTVAQARAADMVAFFEKHNGFTFAHRHGEYRCEQHPSLAVKHDRLSWFWHSKGVGGHGVLDYLTKVENMPFREAVEVATGASLPPPQHRVNLTLSEEEAKPKSLVLPDKKGIPIQIYDYLCNKRGIDGWIVHALMQKGSLYEDKRGNVVFVGFDEHGKARFASVRGIYGDFRGDCAGSDKRYAFFLDSPYSSKVYVFESPIDALSRASMENVFREDKEAWKRKNYLSLAGTTDAALPFFLNKRDNIKEIIFCLDRDDAGQRAAEGMAKKYADKGYYVSIERPFAKDFNEDLMNFRAQIQERNRSKSTHRDVDI